MQLPFSKLIFYTVTNSFSKYVYKSCKLIFVNFYPCKLQLANVYTCNLLLVGLNDLVSYLFGVNKVEC